MLSGFSVAVCRQSLHFLIAGLLDLVNFFLVILIQLLNLLFVLPPLSLQRRLHFILNQTSFHLFLPSLEVSCELLYLQPMLGVLLVHLSLVVLPLSLHVLSPFPEFICHGLLQRLRLFEESFLAFAKLSDLRVQVGDPALKLLDDSVLGCDGLVQRIEGVVFLLVCLSFE